MACLALVTLGLRRLAWWLGTRGDVAAHYSLGGLTRFGIPAAGCLILAWFLRYREQAHGARGGALVLVLGLLFACVSCLGHYVVWFLGLVVPAAALLTALVSPGAKQRESLWMPLGTAVALGGLFVLACWLAASISVPFLEGLGRRLEDRIGSERLLAWARHTIETEPPANPNWPRPVPWIASLPWRWNAVDPLAQAAGTAGGGASVRGGPWSVLAGLATYREGQNLPPYLWPPLVEEVFAPGPRRGFFHVLVAPGPQGDVTILAGPIEYYFARVTLDPSASQRGGRHAPASAWPGAMLEWRPGVYLSTEAPPK